jgi:hypothetical protein
MRSTVCRRAALACSVLLSASPAVSAADPGSLYGIHWWGHDYVNAPIDPVPAAMLDSLQHGAWDLEIVNTHNEFWWSAEWVRPLYSDLRANKNVTPITRINYQWGQTVPSPTNPHYANWKTDVVGVINHLKDHAGIWQLGNEANLTGEGAGWANSQITPAGYAQIYRDVRSHMLSNAQVNPQIGPHQLLVAAPSPGGIIPGVRWMSGNDWLGQALDAIPAGEVDGISLHAYGGTVTEFRRDIAEQIAVIGSKGLTHVPIYITEFNRYSDPDAPDAAAQEAAAAQFLRDSYKFINDWNQRPGNHNIVSATWFVYDSNQTAGGGWNGYSIEYWKTHGHPYGHPGDLFTAFEQTVDLRYRAGLTGTRPLPVGVQIIDSFEAGDGRFTWTPTQSPTTTGALASSFKVRTADDSFAQSYAQKIGILDDPANANGWYVRYVSGGGAPAGNQAISLTEGPDGYIGFFLRVFTHSDPTSPLTTQIVLDTGPTGGGVNSDAGVVRTIIADGAWHWYEWNLDDPADWTAWRDGAGNIINGSDGMIPTVGQVSIDSIIFRGGNVNVEFFFDAVMRNSNGSLAVMIPEPGTATCLLGAVALRVGRSGRARRH